MSKKTSSWNSSEYVLRTEALTEVFREGEVRVHTLPGVVLNLDLRWVGLFADLP